MFNSIDASVHNIAKQIVHDMCQPLSVHPPPPLSHPHPHTPGVYSPMGSLCLSVSMPAYTTLPNRSFMICANPSAFITPVHPLSHPTPTPPCVLTDGVLMFISIDARVHNIAKQIVHDMCQPLSVHHPRTPPQSPRVYSPMGYLCLSVSMPAYTTLPNRSFMICARPSAFITPVHPPQSPLPHTPVCTHRWGIYVYQYRCPRTQHCQTDRS